MSFVNLTNFESTIDNKINSEDREILFLDSNKIILDQFTSNVSENTLTTYTMFRVGFNNPFNFNLSIRFNNPDNTNSEKFYGDIIKTSDDIFNSKFTLYTNNKKLAIKFLDLDDTRKLLLTFANKTNYPIHDIQISNWKNSTFFSTKECHGEIKFVVCGILKDHLDKQICLDFLKILIDSLNLSGILYR